MSNGFDVKSVREDFPILSQTVRGKPLVYLDSAATSQKPIQVIEAVSRYYQSINANVHRGAHFLSEQATEAFESARQKVASFINAPAAKECIFTRGTTEAINLVASSFGQGLKAGDEVLISHLEHHSNIIPWQLLCERQGLSLKVAPITEQGEIDLTAFKALLSDRTRMVALNHISNALGTINPIKEMIALAKEQGATVLVDGAQALPHQRVDVQALGADFYAFSGHKMFAPTGIGVLWGRAALLEKMPPYQGGGEMISSVTFAKSEYAPLPHKFEAGTPNIAGAIGLSAAIDYLNGLDMQVVQAYETSLLEYASNQLLDDPSIRIIGQARKKVSVISFTLKNIHPHDIGTILDSEGIAVRSGHHCAMPVMDFFKVPATVRASLSFYNTKDEVDALCAGLQKVKKVFA